VCACVYLCLRQDFLMWGLTPPSSKNTLCKTKARLTLEQNSLCPFCAKHIWACMTVVGWWGVCPNIAHVPNIANCSFSQGGAANEKSLVLCGRLTDVSFTRSEIISRKLCNSKLWNTVHCYCYSTKILHSLKSLVLWFLRCTTDTLFMWPPTG
jgi:hypothetical protein